MKREDFYIEYFFLILHVVFAAIFSAVLTLIRWMGVTWLLYLLMRNLLVCVGTVQAPHIVTY